MSQSDKPVLGKLSIYSITAGNGSRFLKGSGSPFRSGSSRGEWIILITSFKCKEGSSSRLPMGMDMEIGRDPQQAAEDQHQPPELEETGIRIRTRTQTEQDQQQPRQRHPFHGKFELVFWPMRSEE